MSPTPVDATRGEQPRGASPPAALALDGVTAGYARTTVLRDVSLAVPAGTVVALLGPNGAGKTTALRVAAGLLAPSRGAVRMDADDVTRRPAHARARRGLALVPEGRGVFPSLTVRENLLLQTPVSAPVGDLDAALAAFPVLADRLEQRAGTMSGGQQQMLALARCFVARPRVVLLDEVSMGLAPRIVDEIFVALEALRARGCALLIVEQYVRHALAIADRVYLLSRGAIEFSGTADELDEDELTRRYVGGA